MNIYLVEQFGGSYEDFYNSIISVWDTKEKAENEIIRIEKQYKDLSESINPFNLNISEEETYKYFDYESLKRNAKDERYFQVIEKKLNK